MMSWRTLFFCGLFLADVHIASADDRVHNMDLLRQQEYLTSLMKRLPADLKEIGQANQHLVIKIARTTKAKDQLSRGRDLIRELLYLYDQKHAISHSAAWRQISGWRDYELLGLRIPGLELPARNQNPAAYAEDRGLDSAADDFATFGSRYFLPDQSSAADSIMCKTPMKYNFFKRTFPNYVAALDRAGFHCVAPGEGFLDDIRFFDPLTRHPLVIGPVDADTVEGFELLYATPGVGDAAEIAGHLVLRIRLRNNPDAIATGIENPNDIVVSFLADTQAGEAVASTATRDDEKPPAECRDGWFEGMMAGPGTGAADAWSGIWQALKGLSGGFLTVFDRQTLAQTIRMYTGFQDRNLLRFRLVLSEQQKKSLIQRLYLAKLNYKTKYYFFDRNCASILVQVLGEGIGDAEVANFDPFVVPPNSLIALLRRKGLAEPVYPAFYSYKRRAQVAQKLMLEILAELQGSSLLWGKLQPKMFFHSSAAKRTRAYRDLHDLLPGNAAYHKQLYRLATLGQESEQDFLDREKLCDNYTSEPTKIARDIQRAIIKSDQDALIKYAVDTNDLLHTQHLPHEKTVATTGSPHTKLMSFSAGAGHYSYQGHSTPVVSLRGSLFKQEMGSRSSQAMQRATSVKLGSMEIDAESSRGSLQTRRIAITGLKVQKFKERLERVPAYIGPQGSLGLGLSLLRGELKEDSSSHLIWGGGEILANVMSSGLFDRFLYLHLGLDAESRWGREAANNQRQDLIVAPMGFNTLYTFDRKRKWQLRIQAERRWHLLSTLAYTDRAGIKLSSMFGRPWGAEAIAGVEYRRRRVYREPAHARIDETLFHAFVELNRW